MTLALCFACGEKKFGSLNSCTVCGFEPRELNEIATSLLLSDHWYHEDQLERYSTRIKQGLRIEAPARFRDEVADSLAGKPVARKRKHYGFSFLWWAASLVWSVLTERSRNQRAREIIDLLRTGNRVDYCLYLRPFRWDNRSFFRKSERRLSWLVERRMPLLCLAGRKSALGVARNRHRR